MDTDRETMLTVSCLKMHLNATQQASEILSFSFVYAVAHKHIKIMNNYLVMEH